MSPRRVERIEMIGPFRVAHCDDGTILVRGLLPRDRVRVWPPGAALTVGRARQLVRAIDAAPDRNTLARLAQVVADRYVGDPGAKDLVVWIERRGRALSETMGPPRPPTA